MCAYISDVLLKKKNQFVFGFAEIAIFVFYTKFWSYGQAEEVMLSYRNGPFMLYEGEYKAKYSEPGLSTVSKIIK